MIEKDFDQVHWLAGCDEVGRGPLAGPVVCASVCVLSSQGESVLDTKELVSFLSQHKVQDSKKCTSAKRREILKSLQLDYLKKSQKMTYPQLKNLQFVFQIEEVSTLIIDELNILHASLAGMKTAFENIETQYPQIKKYPGRVFIDGPHLPREWKKSAEHENKEALVKGDSRSCLIALASILAKEYRDFLMEDLDRRYPGYGLAQHAGYPTAQHKEAISKLGVTPIHRRTFKGVKEYL